MESPPGRTPTCDQPRLPLEAGRPASTMSDQAEGGDRTASGSQGAPDVLSRRTCREAAVKPSAVSLFSGAGGMDIGVDQAGFKTVCAIDLDPHCTNTLRRNARKKTVWNVDVGLLDGERLRETLGMDKGDLGLIHGGPPCQPFSQIGKRGGVRDPRGMLIFDMVRITKAFRPKAVMIEQVPYFLRATMPDGRLVLQALATEFRTLGYRMHTRLLNALNYGLPQRRERVFLVCLPTDHRTFDYPLGNGVRRTVGDALSDMPAPVSRHKTPPLPNHIDITPARDRERISYVPEGLWLSKCHDAPPDIIRKLTRKDTTKFRRLDRSSVAPTLRCGEAPYHPTEDRYITPREAARLQGFPDTHVLTGPIREGRAASAISTSIDRLRTPFRRLWRRPWHRASPKRYACSRGAIRPSARRVGHGFGRLQAGVVRVYGIGLRRRRKPGYGASPSVRSDAGSFVRVVART